MPLPLVKHEIISLRKSPEFSEKWLQDVIADDPSILGLGEVEVVDRERVIERSGRLDLLLSDGDSTRYEVELMLGATDPSHIIRCIEYWDAERRRYPGYEHIAVLVAEDITARFLNVISLMAGNIPMIAVQLNALRVNDSLVLHFVEVLNQTDLRRDDTTEQTGGQEVDRASWEKKSTPEVMSICDALLHLVDDITGTPHQLKYLKGHVGISKPGDWRHALVLYPKRQHTHVRVRVPQVESWVNRIEEAGLPVQRARAGRLKLIITPSQYREHEPLVSELLAEALGEADEDA